MSDSVLSRADLAGRLKRDVPTSLTDSAASTGTTAELQGLPGASALEGIQVNFGNTLLNEAMLGGSLDGFAPSMMGELGLAVAGMNTADAAFSPNPAMLRALRNARAMRDSRIDWSDQSLVNLNSPSGGRPLSDHDLQRFNQAFNHDFAHVRIHDDSGAARSADALFAHAYALGAHVYFSSGEYQPGTPSSDRLLAHELTHVVQYDEGRLASGNDEGVSSPTDGTEREAYANEGKILGELSVIDSISGGEEGSLPDAVEQRVATSTGEAEVSSVAGDAYGEMTAEATALGAESFMAESVEATSPAESVVMREESREGAADSGQTTDASLDEEEELDQEGLDEEGLDEEEEEEEEEQEEEEEEEEEGDEEGDGDEDGDEEGDEEDDEEDLDDDLDELADEADVAIDGAAVDEEALAAADAGPVQEEKKYMSFGGTKSKSKGGGGGGGGKGRRKRGRGMAKLQKDLTGMSPDEMAAEVDKRIQGFGTQMESARTEIDAKKQTIADQVDTWQIESTAKCDNAVTDVDAKVASIYEGPKAQIDTILTAVPARIQVARETAVSALNGQRDSLKATVQSEFEGLHPTINEINVLYTTMADITAIGGEGAIEQVTAEKSKQATSLAEQESSKHANATSDDENDKKSNENKSALSKQIGKRAASTIKEKGAEGKKTVAADKKAFTNLIGAMVDGLEATYTAGVDSTTAAVDTETETALTDADLGAQEVDDAVETAREGARTKLETAEQALKPSIETEVESAKASIESQGQAAKVELPQKGQEIMDSMEASLEAVQANCEQLRSVDDPETAKAMLADIENNIKAAKTEALQGMDQAAQAVKTSMDAEAETLKTTVSTKLTEAETEAAQTITDFETKGEEEVSGYEQRMQEAAATVETNVMATKDQEIANLNLTFQTTRSMLDASSAVFTSQAEAAKESASTAMDAILANLPAVLAKGSGFGFFMMKAGGNADELAARAEAHVEADKEAAAEMSKVDRDPLEGRVKTLVNAGRNGAITVEALRGLDKWQAQAVAEMYKEKTGNDLVSDLRDRGLDDNRLAAAEAYLSGDKVAAAMAELKVVEEEGVLGRYDDADVKRALS
ncbi:MAG: DUF4157 domain-containing protein, partial [Proteobacteria bacterium]|nr:DUF4157 domain-containing protein [Pseudomonadota bacterium]